MRSVLIEACAAGQLAATLWVYAGWLLLVNRALRVFVGNQLPRWLLVPTRWVFHEVKPFYLTCVTLTTTGLFLQGEHPGWIAFYVLMAVSFWRLTKDIDDDDDRWKRRKKRLTEKVAVLAGRLQVVPVH